MFAFIMIVFAIAIFFVIVMVIDCHRFVIREYEIKSDKLEKESKWILISDLHNKHFGKNNEKLLRTIEQEKPMGILIAGDIYTSSTREDNQKSAEFVCNLAKQYPVYYANGNHEHKTRLYPEIFGNMYDTFMEKVEGAGVFHLVNEHKTVENDSICIYGLEIERSYYKKFVKQEMDPAYVDKMLGKANPDQFNLLIAHNPDYFDAYAKWGADLTVSGHVHGGLMKLPVVGGFIAPTLRLFPHFDGGEFMENGKKMILSRGLGTHTLPIRIFNPGEIVVIQLTKTS